MLASSFTDPILGIDIHWEFIPMPAPTPTPIPNPFTGIVFDPLGLAVGLALGAAMSAVLGTPFNGPVIYWGAFPATNTGTEAIHIPGHIMIPPGTGWAPIPRTPKPVIRPGETPDPPKPISPDNDAVAIFGSKTVSVMGSNAVRLGDIFLSCSEPVRLPSSVVLAIPKGAPILIGGPPSLDILAAVMASLRTRFMSDSLHALVSRLNPGRFRNLLHRSACFLTGHPVDVASGKVLTEHIDVALPGPLPLQLDRIYSSAWANRNSCFGYGWSSSLDQAVWRERGKVVLRSEDGREIEFDTFDFTNHRIEPGQSVFSPVERLTLRCLADDVWEIEAADGVVRKFRPVERKGPGERLHARAMLGVCAMIESIRDRTATHRVQFFYDSRGYLEWVRDSSGRLIGLDHDDAGRVIALRLPKAQGEGWTTHRRYHYDDDGDLVAVEDALGKRWCFEYATHLLTRDTDRNGASYYFAYDSYGADAWCTRTWGDGGVYDHALIYDKNQHRTWVTDSLGHTIEYQMNVAGMVLEVIDPLGNATQYSYDPETLRRVSTLAPGGRSTVIHYDAHGNPCGIDHPDGAKLQVAYNDRNDPAEAVDAMGGVWTWTYDSLGRVTATTNPHHERSTYGYANGLPAWTRSPGGRGVGFEHDQRAQIVSVKDTSGREVRYGWDQRGRRIRIHEVGGVKLSLHYDAEGNLVELSRPSGERQKRTYDAEGNLVKVEDAQRCVELRYSGAGGPGRRVIAREENGEIEHFQYDNEGRLRAHVDPKGQLHMFERDALGRVVVERVPDGGQRRYTYDGAGFVASLTSPGGRRVAMRYDPRGRVTDVERSDGTFSRFCYQLDGRMSEATNESASVMFERDLLGRILRETTNDDWIASRYDHDGARVEVASSVGLNQGFEHGPSGAVSRLLLDLGVRREAKLWPDTGSADKLDFDRDVSGRELVRHMPGKLALRWTHDDRGRAAQRHTYETSGRDQPDQATQVERVLEDRRWHWRGDDQLVAVEDAQRAEVTRYQYDGRAQLVEEQRDALVIDRAHDSSGNVYRRADRSDREYAEDGRLLRASTARYVYDADGQRTECHEGDEHSWSFGYDDRGLLRAVIRPDGRRIEYEYDALGRRTRKRRVQPEDLGDEPGSVEEEVRYVWDGRKLVHELRPEQDTITWYWTPHDVAPVAKRRGHRTWSIVADHMGNPTEMYDDEGQLSWQAQLDIYGEARMREGEREDCPWRWPGQYEDTDAGLYYNGFRYYDPFTGSYTSRDPLGLAGNPTPYGYPSNVWAWSDPLGLVQDYMEFLSAAKAWNGGEGSATPMNNGFINQTWGRYLETFYSADIPVIGAFGDVAGYIDRAGPGYAKLSLPMPPSPGFHWNTFVNDQWMQAFIDRRAVVMLASEPTEALFKSDEYGRSVFKREMDQLTAAGYQQLGKLGDPNDPLRMEPPCK